MKKTISQKVENLLIERGWTKKRLYDHLKMTGNGFDAMLKNNSISAVRLGEISNFFGISILYFYDDLAESSNRSTDGGAFGEQVVKLFEEQLKAKDQQIAGLQRTVDALVGKSEGVTVEPHSPEMEQFYEEIGGYLKLAIDELIQPSIRKVSPVAMLVAPR